MHVQAFTGYSAARNEVTAVFRGTASFKLVIQDLKITMTKHPKCPKCKVHLGFYNLYKSVS